MKSDWPAMLVAKVVLDRVGETPEQIAAATQRFVEAFEARVGPTDWEVVDVQPWAGTPAELTEIVRRQPSTAATGLPDASDGYAFTLYARREPIALSMGVDVGGPTLGRRLPRQNVTGTLTHAQRGAVTPALAVAMFEALVEAWRPMCGWLTSRDVAVAARRGGWKIPTGYRVWLRDDVGSFGRLARGVIAKPFADGVVLAVPDQWPPDRISARLLQTYERAGVDELPH